MSTITLDDRGRLMAETHHETLWSGIEAWFNRLAAEAADKSWGIPDTSLDGLNVLPMSYETTQEFHIRYLPDLQVDGKPRPCRHAMLISVYRLESGRYEFTCYNS